MTDRLFIDQDGDACLEPHDREDNLVALPARDDDGNILNPEAWERMVRMFNEADAMVAAAFEQDVREAVEAETERIVKIVAGYVGCDNIVDAIRAPQETSE